MLKCDKVFEEFTQALMSFITKAEMVDLKFVINPINHLLKKKRIFYPRTKSPPT
jgi:hypothetical protein